MFRKSGDFPRTPASGATEVTGDSGTWRDKQYEHPPNVEGPTISLPIECASVASVDLRPPQAAVRLHSANLAVPVPCATW